MGLKCGETGRCQALTRAWQAMGSLPLSPQRAPPSPGPAASTKPCLCQGQVPVLSHDSAQVPLASPQQGGQSVPFGRTMGLFTAVLLFPAEPQKDRQEAGCPLWPSHSAGFDHTHARGLREAGLRCVPRWPWVVVGGLAGGWLVGKLWAQGRLWPASCVTMGR